MFFQNPAKTVHFYGGKIAYRLDRLHCHSEGLPLTEQVDGMNYDFTVICHIASVEMVSLTQGFAL